MPRVLAWFSPNDTLLVEQTAVLRVVDYDEPFVRLEVRETADAEPIAIVVGSEWSNVIGALEITYRGIFVNEKCQPARRAGIEFRDTEALDNKRLCGSGKPSV